MRIKPECRYCGTKVQFFGDLCPDCEDQENGTLREFEELTQADLRELQSRQASEDY